MKLLRLMSRHSNVLRPTVPRCFTSTVSERTSAVNKRAMSAAAVLIMPPPNLLLRRRAQRFLLRRRITDAVALSLRPMARAPIRRIPLALSGSPAWPLGGSVQRLHSAPSSESRRPDEGLGSAWTLYRDHL